jgi:hypothetical protein
MGMKLTASSASADSAVAGILGVATNVSDTGVQDSILGEVVAVHVLDSPETSSCYCGLLSALRNRDSAGSFGSEAHGR